MSNNNKIQVNC